MGVSLNDLSTEVLIKIFQYLDIYSLCRLRQTCVRFNCIVESSLQSILKNNALVTNQKNDVVRNRSLYQLDLYEKFRVSHNWKIGRYQERSFLKSKQCYMPWINLSKDHIWISRGRCIYAYNRKYGITNPHYIICSKNNKDICKFVYKQKYIIAGEWDGNLWVWSERGKRIVLDLPHLHLSDVESVDMEQNIIVSGSKDAAFKVWRLNFEEGDNVTALHTGRVSDRIWSVAISDGCQYLAVGGSALNYNQPLNVYDMRTFSYRNTVQLGETFRRSTILDVKWENSEILWTCGDDTCLRKWDLRTGRCEQTWEDVFYSSLYCLDIDKAYTALTGCQRHGRVVLWDTRQKNYVQMYFMDVCRQKGRSSPVYSLSFDSLNLFVATDQHLNQLDFSITKGNIQNYKDIFYKQIVI